MKPELVVKTEPVVKTDPSADVKPPPDFSFQEALQRAKQIANSLKDAGIQTNYVLPYIEHILETAHSARTLLWPKAFGRGDCENSTLHIGTRKSKIKDIYVFPL